MDSTQWSEAQAAVKRARRAEYDRRRQIPVDWIVWPSGNLSLAFRCGHVITRAPDSDESLDGSGKTCPTCVADRRERAKAKREGAVQ